MPVSFTVQVQVGDVTEVLTLVETSLDDATQLMTDTLLVMIRSTQLTFEAQGRPTRWNDLTPSTLQHRLRRARKGKRARSMGSLALIGSIQILRDTGLLLQSVGGVANGAFESAEGFGESDATSAVIGTSRPGWQNQLDDTRGTRDARPFLLIQDVDETDIMDMAVQWALRTGAYAA